MSTIRKRVYSYLAICILLTGIVLSIKPMVLNMDKQNQDYTTMPVGTKLHLRCDLNTNKKYIVCPNSMWIDNITKLKSWIGLSLNLDYWSIKIYECKLKVSDNPERESIPSNECLVLNGEFLTETKDNKINHYIFLSSPQEIECIICSVYTDHYTGFLGKICYIFETHYQKSMTIKEFNRLLTCCNGITYPTKISNNR